MEMILISAVLSSFGLGISSFFGMFLLKHKKQENKLLALLLIALSIRIAKSVFYIHLDLPLLLKNLGLVANLLIGPFLFLYVRSFVQGKKVAQKDAIHFALPLIYLLFSPVLPNGGTNLLWMVCYSIVLGQSFFYVVLTTVMFLKKPSKSIQKGIAWITALVLCLTLMWLVYALIFIQVIPVYSLGPLTFSVTIFILLFIALNHPKLFVQKSAKQQNSRMNNEQGIRYFEDLKNLLIKEKLYSKPDLSLSFLATRMSLLDRDVSYIINTYADCNFSKFINSYRIEEAQKMISQDPSKKLIAVAYESGFNNLGTFNQVFKAFTGQTPSEFRKTNDQNANSFQDS